MNMESLVIPAPELSHYRQVTSSLSLGFFTCELGFKKHLPQLFYEVVRRSKLDCAKVLCDLSSFRKVVLRVHGSPRSLSHLLPYSSMAVSHSLVLGHLSPQWDAKGREVV